MLDNATKRRIDTARDILVGKVPDPKSQVEQITIALIYKFMDDMDAESEEYEGKRSFFSGEFEKYGWSKLMAPDMGGYDVLNLYSEAIQKMTINPNIPQLFLDIFKNAYLPYRDPETLKSFLKVIDDFEYDHSERLGDAFEYLLSVLGSQGAAGQFRTPRHIIDFMVEVINPGKNDTIIDPACGTAGFLISSYKYILRQNAKDGKPGAGLTPDERSRLAQNIEGYDISPDMVRLSLVNMYLHGFTDPHIFEYDTLTSEDRWYEFADVILANPPFMSPKGGIKPHKRFSVQSKRSEVLFVDYIAEHLSPSGRAAVIVPEGIIFQSGTAYKKLRKMLVENFLFGVVSLPSGVFNPYSGVKTSILLIDKTLVKKTGDIIFVKIENDGFDLGAQRRPINKNDLPQVVKHIKTYIQSVRNREIYNADNFPYVLIVEKEKIGENGDWNLSGERYRVDIVKSSHYDILELGNVSDVISGQSPEGIYYNDYGEGTPFYQGKTEFTNMYLGEPQKWTSQITKKAEMNDVLISVRAPVGPVNIATQNICIGRGLAAIRANNEKLDFMYLFYFLRENQDLIKGSEGVAFSSINRKDINKIQIPLPPLEIQKEIVAEVEGYQKIIDGARQVVENYKPQIQIDPEWEMVELGEVCDVRDGTHDSPKYVQKGYPLITSKNVKDGVLDFSNVNLISKEDLDKINQRSKVDDGDIIMPMIGTIGNPIIVKAYRDFAIKNVALIKFYTESIINRYFIKHILDSDYFQQHYINYSSGSTQKFISLGFIRKLKIPLPPIETQNRIVAQIEKEQKLVKANKELIHIYEQKIKDKIAGVWD